LSKDDAALHLAAFLAALRLAAADPDCRNVYNDDSCLATGLAADTASHDAVVALVRAAERAATTESGAVLTALRELQLAPTDGLAGAPLDFTKTDALQAEHVVPLYASTDNPGLRPQPRGGAPASVFWFGK
jgi:hypothetical protein